MAIYKLFSTRQKEAKGEIPDVFTYGVLPNPLRIQIVHILNEVVGKDSVSHQSEYYCFTFIRDVLLKEHALFKLTPYSENPKHEVLKYFLDLEDTNKVLDIVDFAFRVVQVLADNDQFKRFSAP